MSASNGMRIYRPFWLVLVVFVYCITASFLPSSFVLFGHQFKPVDFFSDFKKTKKKTPRKKVHLQHKGKTAADSLHYTGIAFENFNETETPLFQQFCDKLKLDKKPTQKVHIAWFGDSMVEGDILLQDLRTKLQDQFGGDGIGFVPITSVTGNFRQTIYTLNSGNWQTVSILKQQECKLPLGIGGEAFIPQDGSWVSFSAVNRPHLNFFTEVQLFVLTNNQPLTLTVLIDDKSEQTIAVAASSSLQVIPIGSTTAFHKIKVTFTGSTTAYVYGLNFENGNGVYLDNFGLRGSSGVAMGSLRPDSLLYQWANKHPYDLLILEYGLNVVTPETKSFEWYETSFPRAIQRMKQVYSKAAVLELSIGDRSIRKDGVYATLEQVLPFIEIQRNIAQKEHLVFWNMYEVMGGDSSMIHWVNQKPALANKDYTHINSNGGAVMGEKLFDALLFEVRKQKLHL